MDVRLIQLVTACDQLQAISILIQSNKVKIDKKGLSTALSELSDIIRKNLNALQARGFYD